MPRLIISTAVAALLLLPATGRADQQADIARAFAELGPNPSDAQCRSIAGKHFDEPGVALAILSGPCGDFAARGIDAARDKQRNSL